MSLRAILSSFFVVALSVVGSASADEIPEYRLKAEFIERFTRFIEWPETAPLVDSNKPFVIGVVGDDPFGPFLDTLARDRKIKHRPVEIRHLDATEDFGECAILFISSSEESSIPQIIERTQDQPVLTVGDTPGFGKRGILINFYTEKSRIQFEINEQAANKSGLEVRAKLFKLARIVESEEN